MTEIAVCCQGLGKQYVLGGVPGAGSFKELLSQALSSPLRRWRMLGGEVPEHQRFWALKDVDLDVEQGQVLGVVGRNGAGKSTLLKILARITAPSEGSVTMRGTVASLLEVGTGFHPELSGRENIFLNGAVLGMRRQAIRRQFDDIVGFAGVERFLDTPVKRYSSGMHMRLAFSVAAHLQADVMLVDEVLAVGDHAFQQKCLGKMGEVVRSGRAVIFVSHNMQAVQSLCDTAVRFEAGVIADHGPAQAVTAAYLAQLNQGRVSVQWTREEAPGDAQVKLLGMCVDGDSQAPGVYSTSSPPAVEMTVEVGEVQPGLCIGFDLLGAGGQPVLRSYQSDPRTAPLLTPGINHLRCTLPADLLNGGAYYLCPRISIHRSRWIVNIEPVLDFEMLLDHGESPYFGTRSVERPGHISPILAWQRVGPG